MVFLKNSKLQKGALNRINLGAFGFSVGWAYFCATKSCEGSANWGDRWTHIRQLADKVQNKEETKGKNISRGGAVGSSLGS
jgi:hypothetical protein